MRVNGTEPSHRPTFSESLVCKLHTQGVADGGESSIHTCFHVDFVARPPRMGVRGRYAIS